MKTLSRASAKAKAKSKISPEQLKKMQKGLKKYYKEMDLLREKAAKSAKISTKQFEEYKKALKSKEIKKFGRLAAVKAAEKVGITDTKFAKFSSIYKDLRDKYKENKKNKSLSGANFPRKVRYLSNKEVKAIKGTLRMLSSSMKTCSDRIKRTDSLKEKNEYYKMISSYRGKFNYLFKALCDAAETANIEHEAEVIGEVPKATVSQDTQNVLDQKFTLANFMNLIQSDKFFDWFSGDFANWIGEEPGCPNDDQIVRWVAANLE